MDFRDLVKQYRFPALSRAVELAAAERSAERKPSSPLRLSASGYCARRLTYQKLNHEAFVRGAPPAYLSEDLNPRALMVFHLGDMVEASLKHWILGSAKTDRFWPMDPPNDRVSITVAGVEIAGHPDGMYQEDDGSLSLVSIKSINKRGYARVELEGPPYEHVCQETAYMAALGVYKARFLYYCKDTSHIADDWVVEFSIALYTEITNRWARVIGATPDLLPAREHAGEMETEWVRGLKGYKSGTQEGDTVRDVDGKIVTDVKSNGYHRQTGREVLPWNCAYCPYKAPCWGDRLLPVEMDGDRPIFRLGAA